MTAVVPDIRIVPVDGVAMTQAFGPSLPAVARHHMVRGANHGLIAWSGETPTGLLMTSSPSANRARIEYVFTREPFRRRGVARDLLRTALAAFSGVECVEAAVSASGGYADAAETLLGREGFSHYSSTITILHPVNQVTRASVDEFITARGGPLVHRLTRKGFRVLSFAESGEDELAQLRRDIGVHFPAVMDPFRVKDPLPELSFLCVREGTVYGYCLLHLAGEDTAEVACIAVRYGHERLGAALAAYCRSLEGLRRQNRLGRVLFSFDSHNAEMMRLYRRGVISFAGCRTGEARVFRRYSIPPEGNTPAMRVLE
ncbi:MAG: GNAT family N-acetyltransferase [Planctomycetes bacterium]|nr:GNAT family N-acetyltransferase [Planctomycetota bacterium]